MVSFSFSILLSVSQPVIDKCLTKACRELKNDKEGLCPLENVNLVLRDVDENNWMKCRLHQRGVFISIAA